MLSRRKRAPTPGETPGTRKEPGNRNRKRVSGPDSRPAGAGAARQTGQPGTVGRARPPPSHTWRGPCPILPERHAPPTRDTPAEAASPPERALELGVALTHQAAERTPAANCG